MNPFLFVDTSGTTNNASRLVEVESKFKFPYFLLLRQLFSSPTTIRIVMTDECYPSCWGQKETEKWKGKVGCKR